MFHTLEDFYTITGAKSARCSTWDRTGGNKDFIRIDPGETAVLADIQGPGCIRHIYATIIGVNRLEYRWGVLRMYWDSEETPSVEVPFGDFFGVAHCSPRPLKSLAMTLNPSGGPESDGSFGYNCYFPMPFAQCARITLENQGPEPLGGVFSAFWWHIDYERWPEAPGREAGRFHAQWRRENPTVVAADKREHMNTPQNPYLNPDGLENYVLLEAKGKGHLAGIHLQVDNIQGDWYGEGDDAIFIDGDTWPPSLHGTGTEEVFAGGACPSVAYNTPYAGFHLIDNPNFDRFNAMYRWYLADPVRFQEDIRVTIEHGHANNYENDYTSVAYWYQTEPHAPFPALLPVDRRMPRFPEDFLRAVTDAWRLDRLILDAGDKLTGNESGALRAKAEEARRAVQFNRFDQAPRLVAEVLNALAARGKGD